MKFLFFSKVQSKSTGKRFFKRYNRKLTTKVHVDRQTKKSTFLTILTYFSTFSVFTCRGQQKSSFLPFLAFSIVKWSFFGPEGGPDPGCISTSPPTRRSKILHPLLYYADSEAVKTRPFSRRIEGGSRGRGVPPHRGWSKMLFLAFLVIFGHFGGHIGGHIE